MSDTVIEEKPKVTPFSNEVLTETLLLEGQVTVHISMKPTWSDARIRIWKTTFLFAKNSSHKSKLIHFFNITLFPEWQSVPYGKTHTFTLIFSALPKSCTHFDLIEQIPEADAFIFKNIARTRNDVYHLQL